MPRLTNLALSGIIDIYKMIRKALDNNNILVFGARQVGKSTFQKYIYMNSSYFREPAPTERAIKARKYKINYLGEQYESYKVSIQDIGGERAHWADTVRRIVQRKPHVVIMMLRAFSLRPDKQAIKRDEHLIRVPKLYESFQIREIVNKIGRLDDCWYCGEDMDAFNFLSMLYLDREELYRNYPDVMARCEDVNQKLYNKRTKLMPKYLYMVVNFADILERDQIEKRVQEILKPYEMALMGYSDQGVRIRKIAISAKYGHQVNELLKRIGEDKQWT